MGFPLQFRLHVMHMKRSLTGLLVLGLTAIPAVAGTTITPMQGTLGNPFNDGAVHGWGWHGVQDAGRVVGALYDNIATINGGAATLGYFGAFMSASTQAFVDWTGTQAQWGDELHGLPAGAIVTSIRYGYLNSLATATHTIQIYDMIPPSADHPSIANTQFGDQLLSLVLPGFPTGAAIVTVTGLSVYVGTAVWIKFGESGTGFPGTFWLSGGAGNGVGTTHDGVVYSHKSYYGPGAPLHQFVDFPFFYFTTTGYVGANIQVALGGVVPVPAVISLLGLGGLATLRRRRSRCGDHLT